MGLSVNAILAYGVDIGEMDEDARMGFLSADHPDASEKDFDDYILECAGLDPVVSRWEDAGKRIIAACPVEHVPHCTCGGDADEHIFAVRGTVVEAYWGQPIALSEDHMTAPSAERIEAFKQWLVENGVVEAFPPEPGWVMASLYMS